MVRSKLTSVLTVLLVALAAIGAWETVRATTATAAAPPDVREVLQGIHFTCYRIQGEAPPQRIVNVFNQFENQKIQVFSRELLCAPTLKEPLHVEGAPKPPQLE